MSLTSRFNLRGELFGNVATVLLLAVTKLASSLILTRLLTPEIYGIVAILASVLFIIELSSDIGVTGLLVRHARGVEPDFVNTLWTVRLLRGMLNAALLLMAAPWIAGLYGSQRLELPLQVLCFIFVFMAIESMAFPLAIRRQNSRLVSYVELGTNVVSAVFTIVWAQLTRDEWSVIYGMLVQRALNTACSYFVFSEVRPRWRLERAALVELFGFAKHVMPTSFITMALSQYERIVFLRFFDFTLLGLYGIAANIASIFVGLNIKLCQNVLYPRCAAAHRADPSSLLRTYYQGNVKLQGVILGLPALLGGTAQLAVDLLYDVRYKGAGFVLMALMIRSSLQSLQVSTEMMLTAAGHQSAQLAANILRLAWLVPGSLLGFYFFGFEGFVVVSCLDALPALGYLVWRQCRLGLIAWPREGLRLAYVLVLWVIGYGLAYALASSTAWQALTAR